MGWANELASYLVFQLKCSYGLRLWNFQGGGQNSIYSEFPVVNEKQSGIHSIGDQEKFVRTIFPRVKFL